MNLSPYHQFRECRRLERTVENLRLNGAVPGQILSDYRTYHFSLLHKLRSAKYHVDNLSEYLGSKGTLDRDPDDVMYRVNFHFDGFCHVVGSALDIFAREILTYFGIALPAHVYFHTAKDVLTQQRSGDPLLPRLDNPAWMQEFRDYRNVCTHENIVGTSYQIEIHQHGNVQSRRMVFPLPDDPRAPVSQRQSTRNPDVVEYVTATLTRSVRVANPVYCDLRQRMAQQGSLPL